MITTILSFVAGAIWQAAKADPPKTTVFIKETTVCTSKGKKSHASQPVKAIPVKTTPVKAPPVNTTTTTESPTKQRQGGSARTKKRSAQRRRKKAREAQETNTWVSSRTTHVQTNSRTGHVAIVY